MCGNKSQHFWSETGLGFLDPETTAEHLTKLFSLSERDLPHGEVQIGDKKKQDPIPSPERNIHTLIYVFPRTETYQLPLCLPYLIRRAGILKGCNKSYKNEGRSREITVKLAAIFSVVRLLNYDTYGKQIHCRTTFTVQNF